VKRELFRRYPISLLQIDADVRSDVSVTRRKSCLLERTPVRVRDKDTSRHRLGSCPRWQTNLCNRMTAVDIGAGGGGGLVPLVKLYLL
jgi:hypothetical protein